MAQLTDQDNGRSRSSRTASDVGYLPVVADLLQAGERLRRYHRRGVSPGARWIEHAVSDPTSAMLDEQIQGSVRIHADMPSLHDDLRWFGASALKRLEQEQHGALPKRLRLLLTRLGKTPIPSEFKTIEAVLEELRLCLEDTIPFQVTANKPRLVRAVPAAGTPLLPLDTPIAQRGAPKLRTPARPAATPTAATQTQAKSPAAAKPATPQPQVSAPAAEPLPVIEAPVVPTPRPTIAAPERPDVLPTQVTVLEPVYARPARQRVLGVALIATVMIAMLVVAALSLRRPAANASARAAPTVPAATPAVARPADVQTPRRDYLTLRSQLGARSAQRWAPQQFQRAIELGEQAAAALPTDSRLAAERFAQAAGTLREIDTGAGAILQDRLQRGERFLIDGKVAAAQAAFAVAQLIEPNNMRARIGFERARRLPGILPLLADADGATQRGEFARALQGYAHALAIDPRHSRARGAITDIRAQLGDSPAAQAMANGYVSLGRGDLERAAEQFQLSLEHDPGLADAKRGLARSLEAIRLRDAARAAREGTSAPGS
ncbi:MAG: hypothetical protein R3E77_15695 [Steroidobacteraceae bacterium]